MILPPGQAGDNPRLLPLPDDIRGIDVGGRRVRVGRVPADKACTRLSTRTARPPFPNAPPGGPDLCKLRSVVARCFNRLKQFRGLATRFATRAAYHRAEIILARIVLRLR